MQGEDRRLPRVEAIPRAPAEVLREVGRCLVHGFADHLRFLCVQKNVSGRSRHKARRRAIRCAPGRETSTEEVGQNQISPFAI